MSIFSTQSTLRTYFIAGSLFLCSGCTEPPGNSILQETDAELPETVTQEVSNSTQASSLVEVANTGTQQLSEQKPVAESDVHPSEKTTFQVPFPQRLSLFQPPKLTSKNQMDRQNRESDNQGGDVELKGFVDLGELQVLLEIDGELIAIKEGERKAGVEVVNIIPPNVTLQRGRHRWKQSLLDQ